MLRRCCRGRHLRSRYRIASLQLRHALGEGRKTRLVRYACPLHRQERVRYVCVLFRHGIQNDRHDECPVATHQVRALLGKVPFQAKVTLSTLLRVPGNDGNEHHAVANLLPNLPVPDIAAAQLTLVEPDFDTRCPECFADTAGSLGILRGIADKNALRSAVQGTQPPSTMSSIPLCAPN